MSDTIKMDDLNSQAVGLAKKLRKLPKNTNISFRRFAMMHSNAHTQEKRTRKRATMSDQPQTELGELLLELIIEGAKYGYNNNSNGLSSTLTEAQKRYANDLIAQGIALIHQAKKDLLAEVRELQHYKWMCETLHGGYNADEKDVHAALKRYSEREDLRADFAAFFESAAIKEIEEGLTQDTKGGTDV